MDKMKQHGAFSWTELMTSDVKAAKDFYSKLFGWQYEDMPMGYSGYTIIKCGGEEAGGIMAAPPQAEGAPNHWAVYVTVDDTDKTVKLATELGGKIIVPPMDIPKVGRFAVLQDPQGAVISVMKYTNPA